MTRKRANLILSAVILLSLHSRAQFHYTALLDTVKATGFYHISITPELSSYLKTDLSDLRIIDEMKQYIPFITDIPYERNTHHQVLFDQKIVRKETIDSKTILVVENPGKKELSNFIVELKSAAAERTASLSGSDNNVNWFVILDSLLLQKSADYDYASHSQRINFPPGNYKYFKLTINNGKKEPLNIINTKSLSNISSVDTIQYFFVNPSIAFSQADSGKYSLVTIFADRPFHISRLKLRISNPWLYKRQAKIFPEIKNSLQATWYSDSHTSIIISSDEFSGYTIPLLKSQIFYLLIENGDNPPLKITAVTAEQIKRQVIAQLEKGKSYSLLMDNPQAKAPEYDLQHFRDRISDIMILNIKKITTLPKSEIAATKKQIDKWWIWPAIALILFLLAILAWKLTTEMKKNN